MVDEEIVEDSRAGDDKALEYLINKYKGLSEQRQEPTFLMGRIGRHNSGRHDRALQSNKRL